MQRLAALGVVLALALIVWVVVSRGSDSPTSQPDGKHVVEETSASLGSKSESGSSANEVRVAPPIRMRARSPSTLVHSNGERSMAEVFENEAVDDQHSERNTSQVRAIVERLLSQGIGNASVQELSCKSSHCLLELAGEDEPALVKLVTALQDERGFYGVAEELMLSREEDTIRIYLRFADEL